MSRTARLYAAVPIIGLLAVSIATTVSQADAVGSTLIPPYAIWKYAPGIPPKESTAWTRGSFDDSDWLLGQAGFGYGDDDDRTELTDMRGNYAGVRIRRRFDIDNRQIDDELHLYMRFDDGFIAYLNGHEVARSGVTWNGEVWAADDHEADEFEHFVIDDPQTVLRSGANVIAIAGINRSYDSSDFSLDPVLATEALRFPGIAPQLSKQQYLADLDALQKRFEDQSSYLTLTSFDYRQAFATLRSNAGETIDTQTFALLLRRIIAQLGDAHADVSDYHDDQVGYLPFVLADTHTGVIAIEDATNSLLDATHPYVLAIDDISLDDWLTIASRYVSQASPQLIRRRALRTLRYMSLLRQDLNVAATDTVTVTLGAADTENEVTKRIPLSPERLRSGKVPLGKTRLLENNIGYLRIASMSNSRIESIIEAMQDFKDTDGLVIDVRDNSGGRYGILQAMYGYFMAGDAEPYVSNIAAYRLSDRFDEDHIHYRPTFRRDDDEWNGAQRDAIESALSRFEPEWQPPRGKFSDWHFMVLGKQKHNEETYYSNPVVVLSNAGSFSATDGFLSAFADLPQVTLVGSPSAGGSGATQRFELPHSGLEIALSSMASFRPNGKLHDGNGIEVDVLVAPKTADYLGESDTALAKAVSLILSNRRP